MDCSWFTVWPGVLYLFYFFIFLSYFLSYPLMLPLFLCSSLLAHLTACLCFVGPQLGNGLFESWKQAHCSPSPRTKQYSRRLLCTGETVCLLQRLCDLGSEPALEGSLQEQCSHLRCNSWTLGSAFSPWLPGWLQVHAPWDNMVL